MTSPPPRLTRIVIRDLFRSHTVDIPLHHEDRVTVLHGRNGSGKTVALTLINALFRADYEMLARYPYSSMEVYWDDDTRIEVKNEASLRVPKNVDALQEQVEATSVTLTATSRGGGETFTFRPVPAGPGKRTLRHQLRLFDGSLLDAEVSGLSEEEVMSRWISKEVTRPLVRQRVVFIETQRLLRIHKQVLPMVGLLADEMQEKIAVASRDFVTVSGRLDGTIANRVLRAPASGFSTPPGEVLKVLGQQQDRERERLRAIGLLEDVETPSPLAAAGEDLSILEPHDLRILAIILEDQEKKLAVFKDLADSAELMLEVLNRKFAPKHIKLHKEFGYEVTTHDGQPLKLDQLSSGEQHELVLLHKLLFDVPEGTLLLIDEPELSLHVDWQQDFLPDLIRVAKMARFDAILATHSPYIAGDRRDLLVQLGQPVGERA